MKLSFKQRYEVASFVKKAKRDGSIRQEAMFGEVARMASAALGFQVNAAHVENICAEMPDLRWKPKKSHNIELPEKESALLDRQISGAFMKSVDQRILTLGTEVAGVRARLDSIAGAVAKIVDNLDSAKVYIANVEAEQKAWAHEAVANLTERIKQIEETVTRPVGT